MPVYIYYEVSMQRGEAGVSHLTVRSSPGQCKARSVLKVRCLYMMNDQLTIILKIQNVQKESIERKVCAAHHADTEQPGSRQVQPLMQQPERHL
jgi:hypothetical protein